MRRLAGLVHTLVTCLSRRSLAWRWPGIGSERGSAALAPGMVVGCNEPSHLWTEESRYFGAQPRRHEQGGLEGKILHRVFATMKRPMMSHHFDSPTALADGRINSCDLYVFPAAPGTSALILTVNPDAGRSSPTTFRPDALYELLLASDGGTSEDLAFRVTFSEPDEHGRQQVQVRRANGPAARHGTEGTVIGEGRTGEVVSLGGFLQALGEGRYTPEAFTAAPANTFAGRDVTAIALQVPDAVFGASRVAVWGRISLYGHGPQRQVSRIGQPMLRPLF